MNEEDQLRDDFRRFSYECPKCGATMSEYAERCPECGQNLFEVFSGTFRPRRSLGARIAALVLLAVFLGAMLVVFIGSLKSLLRGPR